MLAAARSNERRPRQSTKQGESAAHVFTVAHHFLSTDGPRCLRVRRSPGTDRQGRRDTGCGDCLIRREQPLTGQVRGQHRQDPAQPGEGPQPPLRIDVRPTADDAID